MEYKNLKTYWTALIISQHSVDMFQSFKPVPSFVVEPTNNVPPKKTGDMGKFTGSQDIVFVNNTSWLTCQVTGYPVPRYL